MLLETPLQYSYGAGANITREAVGAAVDKAVDKPVDKAVDKAAVAARVSGLTGVAEAAVAARKEAEEQARKKAEEEARQEAEEEARKEAEEQVRTEAEEQGRKKAEEQARQEAEEQARQEAEEQARQEAEEQARQAAEEQARQAAEEQARREAEEQARQAAEELARQEAEAAEARQAAEEQAKQEAEEQARQAAEKQAWQAAEEQARQEAEEQARKEAEEQARKEDEAAEARQAAEEKARREAAEEPEKQEAEEKARREAAEEPEKQEAEEKARREAAEEERKVNPSPAEREAEAYERFEAEIDRRRLAQLVAEREAAEEERKANLTPAERMKEKEKEEQEAYWKEKEREEMRLMLQVEKKKEQDKREEEIKEREEMRLMLQVEKKKEQDKREEEILNIEMQKQAELKAAHDAEEAKKLLVEERVLYLEMVKEEKKKEQRREQKEKEKAEAQEALKGLFARYEITEPDMGAKGPVANEDTLDLPKPRGKDKKKNTGWFGGRGAGAGAAQQEEGGQNKLLAGWGAGFAAVNAATEVPPANESRDVGSQRGSSGIVAPFREVLSCTVNSEDTLSSPCNQLPLARGSYTAVVSRTSSPQQHAEGHLIVAGNRADFRSDLSNSFKFTVSTPATLEVFASSHSWRSGVTQIKLPNSSFDVVVVAEALDECTGVTGGAVSITIEDGPLGISFLRTNDYVGYAMQVGKTPTGHSQQLSGNRLKIGMQLTHINGQDTTGMQYSDVSRMLKTAGRPLTITLAPEPTDESWAAAQDNAGPEIIYGTQNWKQGTGSKADAGPEIIYGTQNWKQGTGSSMHGESQIRVTGSRLMGAHNAAIYATTEGKPKGKQSLLQQLTDALGPTDKSEVVIGEEGEEGKQEEQAEQGKQEDQEEQEEQEPTTADQAEQMLEASLANAAPYAVAFDEIRIATNDFSKVLGQGAYATVFDADFRHQRVAVKVEKMHESGGDGVEKLLKILMAQFASEINTLYTCRHVNINELLGHSVDGLKRVLM
jgi:hypothetical protein